MMVCHCRAVNDRTIRDEIEAGARDVDELAERCGAGTDCGMCRETVAELVAETAVSVSACAA